MAGPITLTYTDADFRALFPYFANTTTYPESQLQLYFNDGCNYISSTNIGTLQTSARQSALYCMLAHLQTLADQTIQNMNAAGGLAVDAQIDKIRVSIQPPPNNNQMQWWFNQTSYGQRCWALLNINAVGGWMIGGNCELAAFRKAGGGFW